MLEMEVIIFAFQHHFRVGINMQRDTRLVTGRSKFPFIPFNPLDGLCKLHPPPTSPFFLISVIIPNQVVYPIFMLLFVVLSSPWYHLPGFNYDNNDLNCILLVFLWSYWMRGNKRKSERARGGERLNKQMGASKDGDRNRNCISLCAFVRGSAWCP